MKTCSTCKQVKSLSKFYKNRSSKDGYRGCCKTCHLKYQQSDKNKAYQKAYQRNYKKTEKYKAYQKRYCQTEKYKAARKHNPEKIKARNAVNHAIRDGKLPRANTKLCHYCPNPAQRYHHWHGYEPEHWLDVVPACQECDYKEHRKIA